MHIYPGHSPDGGTRTWGRSQPFTPDCHALDTFIESLDYITEFEVGYNASTETFEGHTLDTVGAKWFLRLTAAPRWDSFFDGFHSCYDEWSFHFGMIFIVLKLPYLWPAIWVQPPWQWRQRWGLRQRSGIVAPFLSSCSTMAPTRRRGISFFSIKNLSFC